jgi:transposase
MRRLPLLRTGCVPWPPSAWYERYGRRIEDTRLPQSAAQREAYAGQVGEDGFCLLEALAAPDAPEQLAGLPAIQILGRVWARHFEPRSEGGSGSAGARCARLRPIRGLGRDEDRIESPYDLEARFRTKREMNWVGYMVHLTETCDPNAPRLVIHIDTTPASVHEARRTGPIHAALARKGLTPSAHLVDAAYVSARQLVEARERYGIDLVGPTPQDVSWQHRSEGAFGLEAFTVDWESQRVRCPAGQHSMSWSEYQDKARGHCIKVHFRPPARPAPLTSTVELAHRLRVDAVASDSAWPRLDGCAATATSQRDDRALCRRHVAGR